MIRTGAPPDAGRVHCPLCHSAETQARFERARDYTNGHAFNVMVCQDCSVGFTQPVPADIDPYYPATYRDYRVPVLAILQWLYRAKARRWTRHCGRAGAALQIGCGPGMMLTALRQLGWDVSGLERSEEAAEYGRRCHGLRVIAGDIDSLPLEQSYDFIILFQSLEHMKNPQRIIDGCYRRLKPGGRIVVAVPNFESWQARFGRDVWLHLDIPRHLFHFSKRSLTRLLSSAGFGNIEFQYDSFEHDPFGWVQTALNRMISPPNALLRFLMRLDAPKAKVAASIALGAALALPGVTFAIISWAAGEGAILSAIASKPE